MRACETSGSRGRIRGEPAGAASLKDGCSDTESDEDADADGASDSKGLQMLSAVLGNVNASGHLPFAGGSGAYVQQAKAKAAASSSVHRHQRWKRFTAWPRAREARSCKIRRYS